MLPGGHLWFKVHLSLKAHLYSLQGEGQAWAGVSGGMGQSLGGSAGVASGLLKRQHQMAHFDLKGPIFPKLDMSQEAPHFEKRYWDRPQYQVYSQDRPKPFGSQDETKSPSDPTLGVWKCFGIYPSFLILNLGAREDLGVWVFAPLPYGEGWGSGPGLEVGVSPKITQRVSSKVGTKSRPLCQPGVSLCLAHSHYTLQSHKSIGKI